MVVNRTALERIDMEIEIGIGKSLAGLLYDVELDIHTASGNIPDCSCEYCLNKRSATAEVNNAARNVSWDTLPSYGSTSSPHARVHHTVRSFGTCGVRYQDEWVLKNGVRERVRIRVRADLNKLKHEASRTSS